MSSAATGTSATTGADPRRPILTLRGLGVTFETAKGPTEAARSVDLELRAGEFLAIVGPSGCGKSTLLHVIAGLNRRYVGDLDLHGIDRGRSLGYVFQQDALLPWRTALDNVTIAAELRGVPRAERNAQGKMYLERLGLRGFENHYPSELSGGMRQRVAIARTLIYRPSLVLMDEPFGALDAQTKLQMQALFLQVWLEQRPSVIFVTHDLAESIYLAERVAVMSRRPGRVKRIFEIPLPHPRTSPFEIWNDPQFRELYLDIWAELKAEL